MPSNFYQTKNTRAGDVSVRLYKHRDTAAAIIASQNEDDDYEDRFSLPQSQISQSPMTDRGWIDVQMPLWLAKEKGLA